MRTFVRKIFSDTTCQWTAGDQQVEHKFIPKPHFHPMCLGERGGGGLAGVLRVGVLWVGWWGCRSCWRAPCGCALRVCLGLCWSVCWGPEGWGPEGWGSEGWGSEGWGSEAAVVRGRWRQGPLPQVRQPGAVPDRTPDQVWAGASSKIVRLESAIAVLKKDNNVEKSVWRDHW